MPSEKQELLARIEALERRVAELEGRSGAKRRKAVPMKANGERQWSAAKLADAEFIRPHIAKAMSGRVGKWTAREVARLADIDDAKNTLNSICIVLRGWGLTVGKSGSRHPWTFDGRGFV